MGEAGANVGFFSLSSSALPEEEEETRLELFYEPRFFSQLLTDSAQSPLPTSPVLRP